MATRLQASQREVSYIVMTLAAEMTAFIRDRWMQGDWTPDVRVRFDKRQCISRGGFHRGQFSVEPTSSVQPQTQPQAGLSALNSG